MNTFTRLTSLVILSFSSLLLPTAANAFTFYLENQTNNNYTYTVELDNNDSLNSGDRLILTNLSGVTAATANGPYSITSSDFNDTAANFIVNTAIDGQDTLTGVISLTSADSLNSLEYQAFYTDDGTPRVASGDAVAVPFNPSANLGILILLSGFSCHLLKSRFKRKSNNNIF